MTSDSIGTAKPPRRVPIAIALALYFVAILVRLIGISEPALQGDELLWLKRSQVVLNKWQEGQYSDLTTHLKHPGLPEAVTMALGLAAGQKLNALGGNTEESPHYIQPYQAARVANALASSLVVPVLFAFGSLFYGSMTAALAALLLALYPYHVGNSRMVHIDTMLALFVTLTVFLYVLAVERRSLPLKLLAGFTWGLCIATKVTSGSLIAVFFCFKLIRNRMVAKSVDCGERALISWSDCWAVFVAHAFLGSAYTRLWLFEKRDLGRFVVKSDIARMVFATGRFLEASLPALAVLGVSCLTCLYLIWRRKRTVQPGQFSTGAAYHLLMGWLLLNAVVTAIAAAPRTTANLVRFWLFAATLRNEVGEYVGLWKAAHFGYLELFFRKLPPLMFAGIACAALFLAVDVVSRSRRPGHGATRIAMQLMLGLLAIIWVIPLNIAPKQDYRYVVPVLPALFLFALEGLRRSGDSVIGYLNRHLNYRFEVTAVRFAMSALLIVPAVLLAFELYPDYLLYFNSLSGGFASAKEDYLKFPYVGYREALSFLDARAAQTGQIQHVGVFADMHEPSELVYREMFHGKNSWLRFNPKAAHFSTDYLIVFGAHQKSIEAAQQQFAEFGKLQQIGSYAFQGAEVLRIYEQGYQTFDQPYFIPAKALQPQTGSLESDASGKSWLTVGSQGNHAGSLMTAVQARFAPGHYRVRFFIRLPDGYTAPAGVSHDKRVVELSVGKVKRVLVLQDLLDQAHPFVQVSDSENVHAFEIDVETLSHNAPLIGANWFGKIPLVCDGVEISQASGPSVAQPELARARLQTKNSGGQNESGQIEGVLNRGVTPAEKRRE